MNPINSVNSMNINQVLQQIRTNSRNLLGSEVPTTTKADFSSLLESSLEKVNAMQTESAALKTSYELGEAGVDLPQVMISMQKSSLAFEAMTQVRNKFLSAYQEVMNMPV